MQIFRGMSGQYPVHLGGQGGIKTARKQIGRRGSEGNGRLNGGGALICKRWKFRERRDRASRTRNERREKERKEGKRRRAAFPCKSYSGNSVRLHRPFNVQRFCASNAQHLSSTFFDGKDHAVREIALILVRFQEAQDSVEMHSSRFFADKVRPISDTFHLSEHARDDKSGVDVISPKRGTISCEIHIYF